MTPTIPLEQYTKEVSILKETIQTLTDEVSFLKEQLEWFKKQIFGKKAEKYVDNSLQLWLPGFEPVVTQTEEKKITIPAHEKRKRIPNGKDKVVLPDDLPIERTVIDIPEEAKVCPETGKPLVKIGEEITSKLAHKPGSFYIKQIVHPKYALPKCSEKGIVTAELPETLLWRCQADESLLAEILVKKFADHLPLYRPSEIMARQGIIISRQTLCQWVLRSGLALKPIYDEMLRQILESGNIFFDESPVKMLDPGRGRTQQAYMWVLSGGKSANPCHRIYAFRTSRGHYHAEEILKSYHEVLHSDKYGAYESLANKKSLTWCPCWSHIRRKFIEAESGDLSFRNWVFSPN